MKKTIHELFLALEQELLRLDYTEGSIKFYKGRWKMISEFAQKRNEAYYSEKLGIDFVEKKFNIIQKDFEKNLKQSEVQNLRVIRMLGDFQLHGAILRRYYKHKEILHNQYFFEE